MAQPLNASLSCTCGKVKATIRSPSALRLVCHCVDCRGYYLGLDKRANNKLAPLTPWGGVDLTQIYPSELTFDSGIDQLALARIDPNYMGKPSQVPRVYAKCCNTPLYSQGLATMVNTHLIPEDLRGPVRFNIMGRMALSGDGADAKDTKPNIASSVPFSFCFVMMGRAARASSRKSPAPWELPDISEAEVIQLEPYKKSKKDQTTPHSA